MHPRIIDCRLGSTPVRLAKGRFVMFAYPVVAVVSAMSLCDHSVSIPTKLFLTACLVYPLLYLSCWEATTLLRKRKKRIAALFLSGVPLQYLGFIAALALAVLLIEGTAE